METSLRTVGYRMCHWSVQDIVTATMASVADVTQRTSASLVLGSEGLCKQVTVVLRHDFPRRVTKGPWFAP